MKAFQIIILLVIILLLQSCKKDSNPTIPAIENFVYPFNVGNEWTYKSSNKFTNVQPDSIKYLLNNMSTTFYLRVTRDTILNSHPVVEIKQSVDDLTDIYGYYANEDDGMIKYGYRNGQGGILPKPSIIRFLFNGNYCNNTYDLFDSIENESNLHKVSSDSIVLLDPAMLIYKYPLNDATKWTYSNIEKSVVGRAIVSTPAGNQVCYKIKWNMNWVPNYDVTQYEYINQKGLVKKEMKFKNISITDMNGREIGRADVEYDEVLESFNF